MEHLFHGRVVENKFDLKGSMRNRLVDTTLGAHRETVLLDENLMNSKLSNFNFFSNFCTLTDISGPSNMLLILLFNGNNNLNH